MFADSDNDPAYTPSNEVAAAVSNSGGLGLMGGGHGDLG